MAPSNYLDHSIYGMSRYGRYKMQKILETPYDKIPKNIRELLSTKELDVLKKQARENTDKDVLYFEDNFKLVELKEKAKTNYVKIEDISGNKSRKRTWAKEISNTKKWDFNTFIVGIQSDKKHILNSQIDILLTIQKFM